MGIVGDQGQITKFGKNPLARRAVLTQGKIIRSLRCEKGSCNTCSLQHIASRKKFIDSFKRRSYRPEKTTSIASKAIADCRPVNNMISSLTNREQRGVDRNTSMHSRRRGKYIRKVFEQWSGIPEPSGHVIDKTGLRQNFYTCWPSNAC